MSIEPAIVRRLLHLDLPLEVRGEHTGSRTTWRSSDPGSDLTEESLGSTSGTVGGGVGSCNFTREAERALYPTQTENLNWSRRPPPEVKNLPEAGSAQRPHFQFLSAGKTEINWLLRKFRKKRNKLEVSLRKLGKKEINLGFPSFNPIFKLFIYFSIN